MSDSGVPVRSRQRRALCCACGHQRLLAGVSGGGDEPVQGQEAAGRCLATRKCAQCGERTVHAYLRGHDGPGRDVAEQWMTREAKEWRAERFDTGR